MNKDHKSNMNSQISEMLCNIICIFIFLPFLHVSIFLILVQIFSHLLSLLIQLPEASASVSAIDIHWKISPG